MRRKELKEGVELINEKGDVKYGKSIVAGKKAIIESAISRAALPFPVLMFPILSMAAIQRAGFLRRITLGSRLVELGLVCISLTVALPMTVSFFKQKAEIKSDQLEE